MSSRSVLTVTALLLGTALTAVPALAQTYGGSDNAAQQYRYPTGRAVNDGGMGYAPPSALSYTPSGPAESGSANASTAQNYRYPLGRPMNDGGFPAEQAQYNGAQRAERTGSAENVEHAEARSAALGGAGPNYAYDQPGNQGSYYDYYGGGGGPSFAGGAMDQGTIAACQARFRSFDPATGTYLGFDGMRHSCP